MGRQLQLGCRPIRPEFENFGASLFETIISPRVSETDAVGHINNTVIPVWLEAGRTKLFELFGPIDDFSAWRMIVANFTVDFVHELTYPAPVTVRCWVERIGNSSLTLYEELHQYDRKCTIGRTTYVHVDPETKRPARIPDNVRDALAPHFSISRLSEELPA